MSDKLTKEKKSTRPSKAKSTRPSKAKSTRPSKAKSTRLTRAEEFDDLRNKIYENRLQRLKYAASAALATYVSYLYKSKNSNKFEVRLRRLRYTASAAVAAYASYLYKNKKKNKLSDDFHKRAKRDTEQYKELIELLDDPVFSYMPYYY